MPGKLIFSRGLPACGKTTWAQEFRKQDPENIVIVERDELRTHLLGANYHKGTPDNKSEAKVTAVQQRLIKDALRDGKTVISSDTNLNPRMVNPLAKIARDYGAETEVKTFDVPLEECKRRNKARGAAGGREVPEHVMDKMAANAYDEEGHLKDLVITDQGAFQVSRNTPGGRLLKDYNNDLEAKNPFNGKAVVIVDCDGTLADNAGDAAFYLNNPYRKGKDFPGFYRAIAKAQPNRSVVDLANSMREKDGLNIIVLTGREDSHAKELLEFMDRTGLKASRVIAKTAGDMRPDYLYKKEVLDNLRKEGLVPVHGIDDRAKSVQLMHSEGMLVSIVETPKIVITEDMKRPPISEREPSINTVYGSGHCIRCGSKLKQGNIGKRCATKMNL